MDRVLKSVGSRKLSKIKKALHLLRKNLAFRQPLLLRIVLLLKDNLELRLSVKKPPAKRGSLNFPHKI